MTKLPTKDQVVNTVDPRVSFEIDKPGLTATVLVKPIFKNDAGELPPEPPAGLKSYSVRARLAVDYRIDGKVDVDFTDDDGDSHVAMASTFEVDGVDGKIVINRNSLGHASTISCQIGAITHTHAREKFERLTALVVDELAFRLQTPLHIVQISVREHLTQSSTTTFVQPHHIVNLVPHLGEAGPRMAPFYAMYREGITASSAYYKILCFCKVIEGAIVTKDTLRNEAKTRRVRLSLFAPAVPFYKDMPAHVAGHCGKSVISFYQTKLQKQARDPIAHFVLKTGMHINVSDWRTRLHFEELSYVADLCARECMKALETMSLEIDRPDTSPSGATDPKEIRS